LAVTSAERDRVRSHFSKWLWWGALLGVLPVVTNYVIGYFAKGMMNPLAVMSDGEVLISSTAIAGAAVGELFNTNINSDKLRRSAHFSGGATIAFAFLCAVSYAAIKLAARPSPPIISNPSIIGSIALFVITVVLAAKCIRLAASISGV
jgi:hypothetical protein